jgi:hypothetical protein
MRLDRARCIVGCDVIVDARGQQHGRLPARAAFAEGGWHPASVQNRRRIAQANCCPASARFRPAISGRFQYKLPASSV